MDPSMFRSVGRKGASSSGAAGGPGPVPRRSQAGHGARTRCAGCPSGRFRWPGSHSSTKSPSGRRSRHTGDRRQARQPRHALCHRDTMTRPVAAESGTARDDGAGVEPVASGVPGTVPGHLFRRAVAPSTDIPRPLGKKPSGRKRTPKLKQFSRPVRQRRLWSPSACIADAAPGHWERPKTGRHRRSRSTGYVRSERLERNHAVSIADTPARSVGCSAGSRTEPRRILRSRSAS